MSILQRDLLIERNNLEEKTTLNQRLHSEIADLKRKNLEL